MVTQESLHASALAQFPFLFEQYQFNTVSFHQFGRRQAGSWLALSSTHAHLIYQQQSKRSEPFLLIATTNASFEGHEPDNIEPPWYPVLRIVSFLEARIAPLQVRPDVALSERFEVLSPEVFDLFASEDMLTVWRTDYLNYLKGNTVSIA